MSRKSSNTLFTLITGVAIGTIIGLLFAPEEGKETRKKLKKSFDDTSDKIKIQLDNASENFREKRHQLKQSFEENIENLLSHSGKKADEVIRILEKKLASLKNNASHE